jgi:hypothetical protein
VQVAEAHEEPGCGKGPDEWQSRFAPWLACVAAGSGSGAALTAAPSRTLPSLLKPRTAAAAGGGRGGGDAADGEDGIMVLQGKAASFAEVRFRLRPLNGPVAAVKRCRGNVVHSTVDAP